MFACVYIVFTVYTLHACVNLNADLKPEGVLTVLWPAARTFPSRTTEAEPKIFMLRSLMS